MRNAAGGRKNDYVFWMRWLVDGTHWSTIDAIMVDANTGECVSYWQE